jgi:hypothetical protein
VISGSREFEGGDDDDDNGSSIMLESSSSLFIETRERKRKGMSIVFYFCNAF